MHFEVVLYKDGAFYKTLYFVFIYGKFITINEDKNRNSLIKLSNYIHS